MSYLRPLGKLRARSWIVALMRSARVRAGTLEDQQRYGLALVEIAVGAVILRAELDAADVADARDPPIRTSSTRCIRLLLRL
jgi:hypothetical protein